MLQGCLLRKNLHKNARKREDFASADGRFSAKTSGRVRCCREGRDCGRYAPSALSLPRTVETVCMQACPHLASPWAPPVHGATGGYAVRSPFPPGSSPSLPYPPAGRQTAPNRARNGKIGGLGTRMAFSVSGVCHSKCLVILSVSEESGGGKFLRLSRCVSVFS